MQMIYQDPYESLDPRFRVSSVLAEPLAIHESGISKTDRRRRILEALERADMTPAELYVDRYPTSCPADSGNAWRLPPV